MKSNKKEHESSVTLKEVIKKAKTRRFTAKTKTIAETLLNVEGKFPSISTNDVDQNAIMSPNEQEEVKVPKTKLKTKSSMKKTRKKVTKIKKKVNPPRKRQKISEKGSGLKEEHITSNSKPANKRGRKAKIINQSKAKNEKSLKRKT
mmetsp:Transcript_23068/g.25614  ORF Transcript_23068/g.25614 Transcript_23068/m.25614 type:complete len:147 (+) Transcript_23068:54-494(+)